MAATSMNIRTGITALSVVVGAGLVVADTLWLGRLGAWVGAVGVVFGVAGQLRRAFLVAVGLLLLLATFALAASTHSVANGAALGYGLGLFGFAELAWLGLERSRRSSVRRTARDRSRTVWLAATVLISAIVGLIVSGLAPAVETTSSSAFRLVGAFGVVLLAGLLSFGHLRTRQPPA